MSLDRISLLRDPTGFDSAPILDGRSYDSVNVITPQQANGHIVIHEAKKWPQHVAALSATLSALAAGAVLGWVSPILSDIQSGNFHNITVNNNEMGWIGSFVTLGGMAMCIPTGFLCDLIGRKKTLLLLIIPFTIGWSLILFANSIIMLYLGRLITGMAAGATCVACPLYTSEIAQKDIRGAIGSYFQLMVSVGVFLAYFSGKFLNPTDYTMFCACLPLVFIVTFAFQPETPIYCIRKGCYNEAAAALIKLRGPKFNYQAELNELEGALKEKLQITISISQTMRKTTNIKALLIAFGLMFFQQFSGVNAVIMYTSDIFISAGIKLDAKIASIIVGGFQVVATFISSQIVEKLGRKMLLFISGSLMALSCFFLAIFFTLKVRSHVDPNIITEIGFVPIVALCLFIVVFSLGFGPIPWIFPNEVFTPEIKSVASSTVGTLSWFLAFIITKFYLQFKQSVGTDTTFYTFSMLSVFAAIFVYFFVPETKGKSVEEIQFELEH